MTRWRPEPRPAPEAAFDTLSLRLALALGVTTAAAFGLVHVWSVPLPLIMPVISAASFVAAMTVGLFAYCFAADHRGHGITHWDAAAIFALIWMATGMLSEPRHAVQLFEHLTMAH